MDAITKEQRALAIKSGLCSLCLRRPVYTPKSKKRCEKCYYTAKRCSERWNSENYDKTLGYARNAYHKNREKKVAWQREYRKTPHYKQAYADYKCRTEEYQKERNRAWSKNNPDKCRAKAQVATELRRFRKKNNKMSLDFKPLTTKEWNHILDIFGKRCLKCGSQSRIQIDHVIPLSLGGEHSADNVQPLCGNCNNRKQNKVADYRPLFFSDWT